MNKYKYILWDVDGTLLDFDYSQKISLYKCLERIGVKGTEQLNAVYTKINHKWWQNLELGKVTKEELLPGRFIEFFEECHIQCEDIEAFREQYQWELGVNYLPIEGALSVCEKLKDLGFHQYIVTNGVTSTQQMKLKLSGLDSYMEGIFISEQIGSPKPNKEFFDACFLQIQKEHSSFSLEETLIVGDSMSSDMKGGENAGIDTCYFTPDMKEMENVTYQISKLTEIYAILGVE